MSGEKSHHIYETYKNTVMPHGCHIYSKASDMENQQCVHIHSQTMHYQNGNVYYDVVKNVHILIFLTNKQMISIPKELL